MKLFAPFILFIFVAFLSTPTIVTLIEKNTDISVFYNFAEEESHKDIKEVKADLNLVFDHPFVELKQNCHSKIISKNTLRYNNTAEEIFIPPPDLV